MESLYELMQESENVHYLGYSKSLFGKVGFFVSNRTHYTLG